MYLDEKIIDEQELEDILATVSSEKIKEQVVLSAALKGCTLNPQYVQQAIQNLSEKESFSAYEKAKDFLKASGLAKGIGDIEKSAELANRTIELIVKEGNNSFTRRFDKFFEANDILLDIGRINDAIHNYEKLIGYVFCNLDSGSDNSINLITHAGPNNRPLEYRGAHLEAGLKANDKLHELLVSIGQEDKAIEKSRALVKIVHEKGVYRAIKEDNFGEGFDHLNSRPKSTISAYLGRGLSTLSCAAELAEKIGDLEDALTFHKEDNNIVHALRVARLIGDDKKLEGLYEEVISYLEDNELFLSAFYIAKDMGYNDREKKFYHLIIDDFKARDMRSLAADFAEQEGHLEEALSIYESEFQRYIGFSHHSFTSSFVIAQDLYGKCMELAGKIGEDNKAEILTRQIIETESVFWNLFPSEVYIWKGKLAEKIGDLRLALDIYLNEEYPLYIPALKVAKLMKDDELVQQILEKGINCYESCKEFGKAAELAKIAEDNKRQQVYTMMEATYRDLTP